MRQRRHRQRKQWHNHQRQDTVAGVSQEQKGDNEHMGRDEERYFYIRDVAIEKGSWVLERFMQDLKDSSMLRSPGQQLVVRLGDYYREHDRLLAVQASSVAVESMPAETPSALSMTAEIESSRRGKGKKSKAPPQEEEPLSADDFADVYDM